MLRLIETAHSQLELLHFCDILMIFPNEVCKALSLQLEAHWSFDKMC
jgi:hypothetical protein